MRMTCHSTKYWRGSCSPSPFEEVNMKRIIFTALMYVLLVLGLFACLVGCAVYSGFGAMVGIGALMGSADCALESEES